MYNSVSGKLSVKSEGERKTILSTQTEGLLPTDLLSMLNVADREVIPKGRCGM